ncbi:unnamed protein product [Durusdinium trenchii]|uniref:LON peptidase N-terminal domain and RING finger protein 1 (RING finger protein 191) n=2 Tax=Durusdinium trenchii TaxID=1381693 RepID=A0ABP0SE63_9DINO
MVSLEDCDCALCHELIVHPVVLPCAHVFCQGCLAACLQSSGGRRCPLCRRLLHATKTEDLAVCSLLSSLLEERFPEEYQKRKADAIAPELVPNTTADEELGLFVLEPLLPLQRLHLNVFEPRYCALMRLALASGRRFGMVGFDSSMSHLPCGTEVVIEDCVQLPNGHFHVRVVGTRVFRILEASQHADGYLAAAVSYPPVEGDADGNDTGRDAEDLEAMLKDLNDWQALVRAERPQQLGKILQDLGPRPPASQPGAVALWAAALLNPLPPLGLAPELRAEVLTAGGPERLRLVRRGLETSLGHLQALAKSPLRRYCLWIFRLPAPVAMTAVMVCACLISAIFPAKE